MLWLLRIAVFSVAFLLGVKAFFFLRQQPRATPNQSTGSSSRVPCRDGLISVEEQPGVPLRIRVSAPACDSPQTATAALVLENVSRKPVTGYEVGAVISSEAVADDSTSVGGEGLNLLPGQTYVVSYGGGVPTLNGKSGGEMRSFRLVVWMVRFSDGTEWRRITRRQGPVLQAGQPAL